MNIQTAITNALKKKYERNYPYLYWCIDVHGVILEPTYKAKNEGSNFYPLALETLKLISDDPENKIILWTSSFSEDIAYVDFDLEAYGIKVTYINCNPDCPNTETGNFKDKFYFDILLDDKAGFEPEIDWAIIKDKLLDTAHAKADPKLPKVLIPMITRKFPELTQGEIVGIKGCYSCKTRNYIDSRVSLKKDYTKEPCASCNQGSNWVWFNDKDYAIIERFETNPNLWKPE